MRAWEWFEANVLDDLGVGSTFTNQHIATWYGMTNQDASHFIGCYVDAQRRRNAGKYVLHREGRTSAAWWTVGMRTDDARAVIGQFGDDILHRVQYAIVPDLHRISRLNSRAGRFVSTVAQPAMAGLVNMVEAMMAAAGWQDNDDDED